MLTLHRNSLFKGRLAYSHLCFWQLAQHVTCSRFSINAKFSEQRKKERSGRAKSVTKYQNWEERLFFFNPCPSSHLLVLVREKETSMWETLLGCLLYTPQPGTELQPGYVPWPGIKPTTFQCMGGHSKQLSHTSQWEKILIRVTLVKKKLDKVQNHTLSTALMFFMFVGITPVLTFFQAPNISTTLFGSISPSEFWTTWSTKMVQQQVLQDLSGKGPAIVNIMRTVCETGM